MGPRPIALRSRALSGQGPVPEPPRSHEARPAGNAIFVLNQRNSVRQGSLCSGRNESPFLEEWAQYHLDLGFDRLYYVSTDDDVAQISFPWLLLMSSAYCCEGVLGILDESPTYASDHVKSIVRVDCEPSLGIHSHGVGQRKTCLSSGAEVRETPTHPS